MNLTQRKRGALQCAAALLIALAVFALPEICLQEAVAGLRACGRELLFGIYPFLVVSNLIVTSGCADLLALPLRPLARLLGCRSPAGAVILLLGALGGFAPAASAAAGLVRNKAVTAREGELLLAAAAGSSPSFTILAAGGQMLGSTALGVRLYLCQLAAAWSSVLVLRGISSIAHRTAGQPRRTAITVPSQSSDAPRPGLCAAVRDAASTYVVLCGFIVLFRMLAGAAKALLPRQAAVLPAMLLEVSTGCSAASALPVYAVYGCCAALSLQGASALLQIRAICPPELSLMPLLVTRPLHLLLSAALLRLSLSGSRSVAVYSSLEGRLVTMPRLSPACGLLLLGISLLVCDQLCRTLQSAEKRL